MKKTSFIILIFIILLSSECQQQQKQSDILTIEEEASIRSHILQSVEYISDANALVTNALECHLDENLEEEIEYYFRAIESLEMAKEEVRCFTPSSDNHINNTIKLLILEYQETIEATEDFITDFNFETMDKYYELMNVAVNTHFRLMEYSQAFANLYVIREYDRFSDKEARENLEAYWPDFNFVEADQFFPENLEKFDKKDLFIMWSKQFYTDFTESGDFNRDLEKLRKESALSLEANERWLDFCKQYIFNKENDDELDQMYRELSIQNVL